MAVLRVGFYDELEPGRPDRQQGSIHEAVSTTPLSDESSIVEYLAHGIVLIDIAEDGLDVVSGEQYIAGCSSILSDGSWIWRHDLAYYVARYHLRLDADFLTHLRNAKYTVATLSDGELVSLSQEVAFNVLGMHH